MTAFVIFMAKAFLWLSLIAALAQTAAAIYVHLKPVSGNGRSERLVNQGWLDSLKGVLQALAGLPGWVTIFLAGLALLWTAKG